MKNNINIAKFCIEFDKHIEAMKNLITRTRQIYEDHSEYHNFDQIDIDGFNYMIKQLEYYSLTLAKKFNSLKLRATYFKTIDKGYEK